MLNFSTSLASGRPVDLRVSESLWFEESVWSKKAFAPSTEV